ncbi:hypothetical protein AX16_009830 [Volvariella volvacea WC 439]|nr:hypothetical protein AX16_009830 [Volvariella volvacea WC 439]
MPIETAKQVQILDDIVKAIKYPHELVKEENFVGLVSHNRWAEAIADWGLQPYQDWVKTISDAQMDHTGEFPLRVRNYGVYNFWQSHVNNLLHDPLNKAGIRREVDSIMELALDLKDPLGGREGKRYLVDQPLALPRSPWFVIANGLATIELPLAWQNSLLENQQSNRHVFACTDSETLPTGQITTFALQVDACDSMAASRKLALALSSIQHHRRALGLSNTPVFGATLIGYQLRVYCSEWLRAGIDAEVSVFPTTVSFATNAFQGFLKCYLFLCKLADLAIEGARREFERWDNVPERGRIQHQNSVAARNPWRPQP